MFVRTYGRRNRGGDDTVSDHNYSFSESQESPSNQDFFSSNFPFSSQESTSYSLDPDPYSFDENPIPSGVVPRKSKKARHSKSKSERPNSGKIGNSNVLTSSTTLMEAQEFGEMMEHVDEVNFSLDGLKKGQPLRIKRASLLSLLRVCGTQQQRRLLRTQGYAGFVLFFKICLGFLVFWCLKIDFGVISCLKFGGCFWIWCWILTFWRLVSGMFLELKVWKFWGFCKFLNLDKRVDLNLERLNLGVIEFREGIGISKSSDFELLHCSFKGGFIEILVEFWNSYFSWWLLEECAAFFFFVDGCFKFWN